MPNIDLKHRARRHAYQAKRQENKTAGSGLKLLLQWFFVGDVYQNG